MRVQKSMKKFALLAALTVAAALPLNAQGWLDDIHGDLNDVQSKTIALANALPESAYDWRPSAGARSVRELFLHVVADNYLLPMMAGRAVPAGIAISDYPTSVAYEKQMMTKAQVVAALQASFVHLHQGLNATVTEQNLNEQMNFFGTQFTRRRFALATTTHLHEHLGQAIAYTRSNNIVPPWSR